MSEIEELKEMITSPKLVINRLPRDVKERFQSLANRDFCSDYGMTLKFLLDKYLDDRLEFISAQIKDLNKRIEQVESKPIKAVDGTIIRKGGN